MRYSSKVAYAGLFIGINGAVGENEIVQIGSFLALSAACICRSIEDLKEGQGDA